MSDKEIDQIIDGACDFIKKQVAAPSNEKPIPQNRYKPRITKDKFELYLGLMREAGYVGRELSHSRHEEIGKENKVSKNVIAESLAQLIVYSVNLYAGGDVELEKDLFERVSNKLVSDCTIVKNPDCNYMRDSRVAIGCLHELMILVTSCISKNASEEVQQESAKILARILSTGLVKKKPMYYRFDWEQALYERYLDNA